MLLKWEQLRTVENESCYSFADGYSLLISLLLSVALKLTLRLKQTNYFNIKQHICNRRKKRDRERSFAHSCVFILFSSISLPLPFSVGFLLLLLYKRFDMVNGEAIILCLIQLGNLYPWILNDTLRKIANNWYKAF